MYATIKCNSSDFPVLCYAFLIVSLNLPDYPFTDFRDSPDKNTEDCHSYK